MKKKLYFISTLLLSAAVLSLSSCLKDDSRYTDFSKGNPVVEFNLGGTAYFGPDAITESTDTVIKKFAVSVASVSMPSTATTITLAVDNSLIAPYVAANPAVPYVAMPANAFVFTNTSVTIPAGQRVATVSVTIYKDKLDPSKSYMLPIKIAGTTGGYTISSNMSVHYYHFIGNDFAGTYTYDFRRYQNGIGPGAGMIPSLGQGSPPDITDLGVSVVISPVTPTEFQMETEYNGQGVNYDVTFTRTVGAGGVISYTDWAVTFLAGDIAKWTAAGIENKQAPAFTIPPPATSADPKKLELNYISGGASGRYIDDTYTKQ
jgi:hypothetical protein